MACDRLERILSLAAERRVDAVTFAGDLYEQDHAGPGTMAICSSLRRPPHPDCAR